MTTRREVTIALGAGALLAPFGSFAQQPMKINRIGLLIAETISGQSSRLEALRAGLKDFGYVEGKNIVIEIRSAEGHYDRLPDLAVELVHLRPDLLVAFGAKAVAAGRLATTTIPIVVPSLGDPIGVGLATSFASPGGNIVGSDNMNQEIYGKRLELLKETVQRINSVGLLMNPAQVTSGAEARVRAAAKSMKLEFHPFGVRESNEFGNTFSAMAKARIQAIVVQQDTLFAANAREIAERATKQRLPSVGNKEYAEAGGLIGYGVNDADLHRRAAYFIDRILKGAKPSDIPIERPMRLELVINLKTAKALGINIPNSILVRATKLIE